MNQLTRERLEWFLQISGRDDIEDIDGWEIKELARRALVVMDSKPLAWTDAEELRDLEKDGYAAMLSLEKCKDGDPRRQILLFIHPAPARKCDQVRREHAEWSQATFGNFGPVGPLKHLSKEALEAAAEPDDLSEWADIQLLMWDAQRRAGITDEQITQAMIEKLAVNKQREWPEPKDGEPRLHVKQEADNHPRDSCAIVDVIAERQRQQSVKGFSTEQDDTYVGCQLAAAAICYIEPMEAMSYWPADWHDDSFKPTNERRNLVKAAALIIAEIERIDRKSDAELKNE